MVEELAEEREPGVERRGQPLVRSDVGQIDVVALHFDAERLEGCIAHAARSIKSSYGHRVGRDRGITGIDHRRVRGSSLKSATAACITTLAWYSASDAGLNTA